MEDRGQHADGVPREEVEYEHGVLLDGVAAELRVGRRHGRAESVCDEQEEAGVLRAGRRGEAE